MTTLRVIVDQIIAPVPGGIGRYAEELTRQLIATAPGGARVAGIVSASATADYATIADALPGLAEVSPTSLTRRWLSEAWRHGFTRLPGSGSIHATSLLAPLHRHDHGSGEPIAVTIHDAVPWTHPETLPARGVSWHRAMTGRAQRYADAIVVPTHAVANELDGLFGFGDRLHVIGGATSSTLVLPADTDARAAAMRLPERYILSVGTLEPRKGIAPLIQSLRHGLPADVPLLIAGPYGWGGMNVDTLAREAGLAAGRVRALGPVSDTDLALLLDRAEVFVYPSLAEGFGLPVVEAFTFGTPVVHSDAPALLEVAGGAGLAVPLADAEHYPARLAEAIAVVLDDSAVASRLRAAGPARAKSFSWRDSAEKVWRLHADL